MMTAGLSRPCGHCMCFSNSSAERFFMRNGATSTISIAKPLCNSTNSRRDVLSSLVSWRQSLSGRLTSRPSIRLSSNFLRTPCSCPSIRISEPNLWRNVLSSTQSVFGTLTHSVAIAINEPATPWVYALSLRFSPSQRCRNIRLNISGRVRIPRLTSFSPPIPAATAAVTAEWIWSRRKSMVRGASALLRAFSSRGSGTEPIFGTDQRPDETTLANLATETSAARSSAS